MHSNKDDYLVVASGSKLRRWFLPVERLNAQEGKMVRSNIRERNILFSGQKNSCLSFIAEAIAKKLLPPKTQVFSAGLKQDKFDPKALQVLGEIGIKVATQEARGLDVIPTKDIDLIVMLGEPGEAQPTTSPRAKVTTWDIPDPCREPMADLEAFRRARDEINNRVGGLFLDYWRNLA
jgi:protein-tyrosine-phosphatase